MVHQDILNKEIHKMMAEWFPTSFSYDILMRFVTVKVSNISTPEMKKMNGEYQSYKTPLMLVRRVQVFDEYEVDYDMIMNKDFVESSGRQVELLFIGAFIAWIDRKGRGVKLENKKLYTYDGFGKDWFNDLCVFAGATFVINYG